MLIPTASTETLMIPVLSHSLAVMTMWQKLRAPCPTESCTVSMSLTPTRRPCSLPALRDSWPSKLPAQGLHHALSTASMLMPARCCGTGTLRNTALRLPMSAEYASNVLPDGSITVMCARHVPPRAPCPSMHRGDVSNSHSLPLHPVCPPRPMAVKTTNPRPAPCTLIDADPVQPLLPRCVILTLDRSTSHACVIVAGFCCCYCSVAFLTQDDDDCFYYHSWRNNVVIAFGTLSSFLTQLQ